MRSFSDDSKFTVRSVPEIFEIVTTLTARYRGKGIEFDGRKISREILLNGLFLHFDALDPKAQMAAVQNGLARLAVVLSDGGENGRGESGPGLVPEPTPPVVSVVVTDVTDPKSRRKHRG